MRKNPRSVKQNPDCNYLRSCVFFFMVLTGVSWIGLFAAAHGTNELKKQVELMEKEPSFEDGINTAIHAVNELSPNDLRYAFSNGFFIRYNSSETTDVTIGAPKDLSQFGWRTSSRTGS